MISSRRARFRGIKAGYRSGLEEDIADELTALGIPVVYETDRLPYTWPSRLSSYKPDFKLPKPGGFFYLETKGLWVTKDRQWCDKRIPDEWIDEVLQGLQPQ